MRRALTLTVFGLCIVIAGCGDGRLRTKGQLLKDGQPFIPPEGEYLEITFVPILPDGKPAPDYYYAEVDQATGTFRPAGKYRVAVELMKKKRDQFGGKFDTIRSPFVFDVDSLTKEIVIDLDKQ
jgi:hypothetical protein